MDAAGLWHSGRRRGPLPQRLDKSVLVSTTVIFFAVINVVKIVPYAWLGLRAAQPHDLARALAARAIGHRAGKLLWDGLRQL
jgi:hypothetical protein